MLDTPSKKRVSKAGATLASDTANSEQINEAMQTLSQWRALHNYPLNAFQANLRRKCKSLALKSPIIAQRLKRAPSIIGKLKRFPEMNLARMQDIGGLRVIVSDMKEVDRLHECYLAQTRAAHRAVLPPKDYITHPKADGYRSLHQVFAYQNKNRPELDGLKIELQIRTKLQHAWATAVETLGMIEKTSFKTGQGSDEYKRFFLLCSALFALKEKTPLPESLHGANELELIQEMKGLIESLNILQKLNHISKATKQIEQTNATNAAYYIMILDIEAQKTSLIAFTENQFEYAKSVYLMQEQALKDTASDVVLISINDVKEIKRAYPNYFLDTQQFLSEIHKLLNKQEA